MSDRLEKLEAELKEMREQLESTGKEMRKVLAASSDEAKEAFADFYDDAQQSSENLIDEARHYGRRGIKKVRKLADNCPIDNPWLVTGALTGIAIAGVVTTLLMRRDNHDWRSYLPEDSINDLLRKIR